MCAFSTSFLGYCSFCHSWIWGEGGFLSVFFSNCGVGLEGREEDKVSRPLDHFPWIPSSKYTQTRWMLLEWVSEWVSERECDYLILGVLGGETGETSLRVLVAVFVHVFLKCFSSEWILSYWDFCCCWSKEWIAQSIWSSAQKKPFEQLKAERKERIYLYVLIVECQKIGEGIKGGLESWGVRIWEKNQKGPISLGF